jgi:hypothetical protein
MIPTRPDARIPRPRGPDEFPPIAGVLRLIETRVETLLTTEAAARI